MGIFRQLFGKKSEPTKNQEVMVSIAESIPNITKDTVIYSSQIPAYVNVGNLIFEKRYEEAISLGNKLLKDNPQSAGMHVNLMDAYFKARQMNESYYEKSTEHARLAMLYGNNTGYVQERLVINLTKDKKIYQAIQVCDIILSDGFHFSKHGCGNKEDFAKRKAKLLQQTSKSIDNENSKIFSQLEIQDIINHIKENEIHEIEEQQAVEKRLEELRKKMSLLSGKK